MGLTSASDLSRFTWVVESFNEGWSPESRVEFKKHLTYNVSRIVPVTQEEARSKAVTRSSLPNPEHNEDEGNGESLSHPGIHSGYNHLLDISAHVAICNRIDGNSNESNFKKSA